MRELDRGRELAVRRRAAGDLRAPCRTEPSRFGVVWRRLKPRRPADAIAAAIALVATSAVLVNALVLQTVLHPAPMFGEAPPATVPAKPERATAKHPAAAAPAPVTASVPTPAPAPLRRSESAVRADLVLELQRELARRGYYDGLVDGLFGPRTDQAIRDFERAQGLKITGEPSEALLARILRTPASSDIPGMVAPAAPQPSTRVLAVQRVLARLGYGPVRLNGIHDPATRSAIERFERDRGLALTGEISDRLLGELAAVTGAPIE